MVVQLTLLQAVLMINLSILLGGAVVVLGAYLGYLYTTHREIKNKDQLDVFLRNYWLAWVLKSPANRALHVKNLAKRLKEKMNRNDSIKNYDGSSRGDVLNAIELNDILKGFYYNIKARGGK